MLYHVARSYSSLAMAMFVSQGWNAPPTQGKSGKYPLGTYGNRPLQLPFREEYGGRRLYQALMDGEDVELPPRDISSHLPAEPWVHKADPNQSRIWNQYPHLAVSVYRNRIDNARSIAEKDERFNEVQARRLYDMLHGMMPKKCLVLDMDAVMAGDFEQLALIVKMAGGEFDEAEAAACIMR